MVILAYIDPGAGSLLLQMLVAGALGAAALFRSSIAALFGRGKKKETANFSEEKEENPVKSSDQ